MISISRDGKEIGEWNEDDIRSYYEEGRLVGSDLFWKQGMDCWEPLTALVFTKKAAPPFPKSNFPAPAAPAEVEKTVSPAPGIGRLHYFAGLVSTYAALYALGYIINTHLDLTPDQATNWKWIFAGLCYVSFCLLTQSRYRNAGYESGKAWLHGIMTIIPIISLIIIVRGLAKPPENYSK